VISYRYCNITKSNKQYSTTSLYHKSRQEVQDYPSLPVTEFSFNESEWDYFYVFLTERLVDDDTSTCFKETLYNTCNALHFIGTSTITKNKRKELLEHYTFPISTWTNLLVYFFIQVSPECSGSGDINDVYKILSDHLTFLQEACDCSNMAAFLAGMKIILNFSWNDENIVLKHYTKLLFKNVTNNWKMLFMVDQNYSNLVEFLSFIKEYMSDEEIKDMSDELNDFGKLCFEGNVIEKLRKKMEDYLKKEDEEEEKEVVLYIP